MPKNQKKIIGSFIKKKKPHFVKNAKFQRKKISKKLDGVLPAMSRLRLNNYAKKNPQVHTKKKQEKLDEELRSVWKRMDKLSKDFYSQETKLRGNPLDAKKGNKNEKPSSEQNVKTRKIENKKKESLDGKIEKKKKPKTKKKKESLDGKIKKKTSSEQNMNEKTENVKKNEKPSSVKNEKKESLGGKIEKKKLKTNKKKPVSILLPPRSESRVKDKWKGKIHKIDIDEGKNEAREYVPQAYEDKLMPGGQQNDMMMMAGNTTNGHLLIGGQNKRSMWVDSNYSSSSSQNNHDTKNDDSNRWTNNHLDQNEESINENDEIIKAMNDQRMNSFLYGVNGPLGMNNISAFPGSSVRSD